MRYQKMEDRYIHVFRHLTTAVVSNKKRVINGILVTEANLVGRDYFFIIITGDVAVHDAIHN